MTKPTNNKRNDARAEADALPIKDETLASLLGEVRKVQDEAKKSEAETEATTLIKVLRVCTHVQNLRTDDRKKIEDHYTPKKGRPTTPELQQYAPVLKMALPGVSATLRTRLAKALYQLENAKSLSVGDTPDAKILNTVEKSGGVIGLAEAFDTEMKRRTAGGEPKAFAEMDDTEFVAFAGPVLEEVQRRSMLVVHEASDGSSRIELRVQAASVESAGHSGSGRQTDHQPTAGLREVGA